MNSNTGVGIFISGASDNIISNNYVHDNSAEGILISGNSDNNVISGNVSKTNTYGIRISAATCDKNILMSNICLSNTTSNITDAGTNTHPNGASGTNNLALDDLNIIA